VKRESRWRGCASGACLEYSLVTVHSRLKSILAFWFILQIALPFTAPLQMCDLGDLLGMTHHRGAPASPVSPESSTTPTARPAGSFASPLAVLALRTSPSFAAVRQVAAGGPLMSTCGLSPSPHIQQTVLRV
jgi:hypothetical protein